MGLKDDIQDVLLKKPIVFIHENIYEKNPFIKETCMKIAEKQEKREQWERENPGLNILSQFAKGFTKGIGGHVLGTLGSELIDKIKK